MTTTLSKPSLFSYGLFALPLAFASLPIYIHAPEFYAVEYGVSLAALGGVLLLMRLLDALLDPLLGAFIDRSSHRHRLFSMLAMVLFAISFYGLFHPGYFPPEWLLMNFSVSLFLVTLAYSFLSILLNTQGGVWSEDESQHTRITTVREGIGLIGLLLAAAMPSLLQREMSVGRAFHVMSIVFVGFVLVCGVVYVAWQRTHMQHGRGLYSSMNSSNLSGYVPILRSHVAFYCTYFVSVFASSIPAVLVLFFIRDRLGGAQEAGLFLLLYFLAGALGMPLWSFLARRIGQTQSWALSMVLAIVSFVWAYLLGTGDFWQYGVICVVSGVAFGAELSLPPAMVAGAIAKTDNHVSAGKRYALLTFCLKASVAVAAGLTLPVLQWAGYTPAHENSDAALHALSITYALVPCGFKVLALGMLLKVRKGA